MATARKVLGQAQPPVTTLTTLYTVPAGGSAVCSTLVVCNTGAAGTFAVTVSVSGFTYTDNRLYLFSGQAIAASQTITLTIGITLGAGDKVSVYSSEANVAFNLFGEETT